MAPILEAKNIALDFAEKVGTSGLVKFSDEVRKMENAYDLDPNVVDEKISEWLEKFKEDIAKLHLQKMRELGLTKKPPINRFTKKAEHNKAGEPNTN
jgi:hypothetical protein